MQKRSRKAVFYALLALFPFIGAGVILYAQGWRFDFVKWRVEKVGAILIESYPSNAAIALDGKPIANQTNFLSRTTVISGLLPENYELALSAQGYDNWTEDIAIYPSLVTELRYAVLVPSAPSWTSTSGVRSFGITASGMAFEYPNGWIMPGAAPGAPSAPIARGTIVSADPGSNALVYRAPSGLYELYNIANSTTTDLSAAFARGTDARAAGGAAAFMLDPSYADYVVAYNAKHVWLIDTSAARPKAVLVDSASNGASFGEPVAAPGHPIAWTQFSPRTGSSTIVLYDTGAKTLSGSPSDLPGRTIELEWIGGSLIGALQNDGSLFTYDANAQTFKKIADGVKRFDASPDGSAIAALENSSFEVIPMSDAQTYHRFNLRDMAGAISVAWYGDSEHVFISYEDSVSFLDLADSGLKNLRTVAKGINPLYNRQTNIFYIQKLDGNLESFDFPS